MKLISYWLCITFVMSTVLCGCKSPETAAYLTMQTITVTVTTARDEFYKYRATHGVSADVEARAKQSYQTFQRTWAIGEVAQKEYYAGGDRTVWQNTYWAVIKSGNQFLDLARIYLPTTPKLP